MLGVVTPYTVSFAGLLLAVAALHPFGLPPYMNSIARRSAPAAVLAYFTGLACAVYAIYGTLRHQPWAVWLVFPALCYWFFLTDSQPGSARMAKANHNGEAEGGGA